MVGPRQPSRRNHVEISGDFPEGGAVWYGRNTRRFGGEFFLGLSDASNTASVRIPEKDRVKVARLMERFAKRLRGGR